MLYEVITDCRVSSIKYKQADGFVRALTAHGLKDKTVQEYKAACAQMFGHAVKMEYLSRDPFEQITIKNRKPTPRTRWQSHELKRLFTSEKFRQPSTGSQQEDYWIPLLLLHSGARPSEICQLRCQDVVSVQGVMCLRISNEGEGQSVKTANAIRHVPLHSRLLALGWMRYVQRRRKQGQTQLFDCKPTGKYGEWSKNFEQRFNRYLHQLGFAAGQRPTAYSFRHTVIDELKRREVPEYVTAELVGQSRKGITYGHYGKAAPVSQLKQVVEMLDFGPELAALAAESGLG